MLTRTMIFVVGILCAGGQTVAATMPRGADGFGQGVYSSGGLDNAEELTVGPLSLDFQIYYMPTLAATQIKQRAFKFTYLASVPDGVKYSVTEGARECGVVVAKQVRSDIIDLQFSRGGHFDVSIAGAQGAEEQLDLVKRTAKANEQVSPAHPVPADRVGPACG